MKRNKDRKAKQRIICTYHLDSQGQRDLDDYVNARGIKYADFMVLKKSGAYTPFMASNAFRRIGKTLTKVLLGTLKGE